jgi:hypothetical protein
MFLALPGLGDGDTDNLPSVSFVVSSRSTTIPQ